MKRQREAAKKHEQLIQQKRREVEALRKADRTLQKKMGRLQLENRSHKVLLDRKDNCIRTLKEKAAKAETHVMRLLQLQNRSRDAALHKRTPLAATGGGASSRATPHRRLPLGRGGSSKPGAADASPSAQVNGEKVEAARFLLEKVVEERLAELEARKQLEQKTKGYEALVRELRAQAAALERLKAEEEEEGGEEGEQEEVEEAIREAEARLQELDVEMELCANAIGELQICLEAAEQHPGGGGNGGGGSNSGKKKGAVAAAAAMGPGLNEEAALQAVSELGAGEARVLLAGLVEGMVDARARAWDLETETQRRASAEEGLRLDKRKLERRLSESARGFEQRLTDLRSQHQKDLITLVRGAGSGGASSSSSSGVGVKAGKQEKGGEEEQEGGGADAAQAEREEEQENAADEVAKRQLEALAAQNDALETRCQGLATELGSKTAAVARLQQEAEAAQREARELRGALEVLKQAGKGPEEEKEDAAAMEELLAAWGELGLSEKERRGLLGKIQSAPRTACQRLLDEAKGQRDAARARVAALRTHVRLLTGALGLAPASAASPDEGDAEDGDGDLLVLQEALGAREAELRALLGTRVEAAQRLTGEAQRLLSSLGPDLGGGRERERKKGVAVAVLADLQQLFDGMGWGEGEEAAAGGAAEDAVVAAARKVVGQGLPALSEASLQAWEAAVKGLRVARADLVLQLQDMLERARGACALLGLDADALVATLRAALAREARTPPTPTPSSSQSLASPVAARGGPGGSRRRSSISPLPAGLRMDDAALRRMVKALAEGGGGAVAGLWAEEMGAGTTLREALPQTRFIVEVGVECWNRRRELLGLCRGAATGLAEAVAADGRAVAVAVAVGGEEMVERGGDVQALEAGVEAVRAALPEQEEAEEEGEGASPSAGPEGTSSSATGMTEAEAEAFVGAVEGLLASVESRKGAAKAALEALWDYFKVRGWRVVQRGCLPTDQFVHSPINLPVLPFPVGRPRGAQRGRAGAAVHAPAAAFVSGRGEEAGGRRRGGRPGEHQGCVCRSGVICLSEPIRGLNPIPPTPPPPPKKQPLWSARRGRGRRAGRSRRGSAACWSGCGSCCTCCRRGSRRPRRSAGGWRSWRTRSGGRSRSCGWTGTSRRWRRSSRPLRSGPRRTRAG